MAALTIRDLDDGVKARLRVAAAREGVSMEEQARRILGAALSTDEAAEPLGAAMHRRFAGLRGGQLHVPARQGTARHAEFD